MQIHTRKVGILGAGKIGAGVALQLAVQGLADEVILFDRSPVKAVGEAMDLMDSVTYLPHHFVAYGGSIADMKNVDIVVNCAGRMRYPGETRLDMIDNMVQITDTLIDPLSKSGFDGIIISISNPSDVIAQYLQYRLDWPKNQIFSTGTALDSARLQMQLSARLDINRRSIHAYMLGEHGDSCVIPWSQILVAGRPVKDLLAEKDDGSRRYSIQDIEDAVRGAGAFENQSKGGSVYGVASAAAEMIRAIYHNEHKVIPCSIALDDVWGVTGGFASVPVQIGENGVEDVIDMPITDEEMDKIPRVGEYFERVF